MASTTPLTPAEKDFGNQELLTDREFELCFHRLTAYWDASQHGADKSVPHPFANRPGYMALKDPSNPYSLAHDVHMETRKQHQQNMEDMRRKYDSR